MAAVVPLLLAPLLIHGAPQQGQEPERSESTGDSLPPTLVNPFAPADESRRLLQSYIRANWKERANPDVDTREQEVFFLFSLHDYDKSGQLDGLELMKLLSDFLSHHSQMPKSADGVVAMVDYLLQTQDQNQDGLLAPSELLSPPIQGSKSEPIPGSGPAEESDSLGGSQAQPKEEAFPEQAQQDGELAQKGEADGGLDAANKQEHPQEETQEEAQAPEEQNVDRVGEPEEEKQASQQEPPQEEQPEAQEQQQQAEEQRLDSNAVEHPPVHQGQPEM